MNDMGMEEPEHDDLAAELPDRLPPDAFSEDTADNLPDRLPASAFNVHDEMPDRMTVEEFNASEGTATRLGAVGRGAAEGAGPGVVGLTTGVRVGAALAPAGPLVATAGGLAAGVGAGMVAAMGQDWLMEKLGMRDKGWFSRQQQITDESQYPYSKAAGNMAPTMGLLRFGGTLAERAISGAVGGVAEAGADYVQTGKVDPVKVAMGVGAGVAMPNLNKLGRMAGGIKDPVVQPAERGLPRPDAPLEGEVLPPEPPQAPPGMEFDYGRFAEPIKKATSYRDNFDEGSPAYKFWNDHIVDLQTRAGGKGGLDVDASQGPASDQNPFTYRDADKANDQTTTSIGIAMEHGPAPRVEGAGNPVGSPMEGRVAARPSSPLRDYRKLPAPLPEGEAPKISSGVVQDDVALAMGGIKPGAPPAPEAGPPAPRVQEAPPVLAEPTPEPHTLPAPAPEPLPARAAADLPAPTPEPLPEMTPEVTAKVTPDEKPLSMREKQAHQKNLDLLHEKGLNVDAVTSDPRWAEMTPREQAVQIAQAAQRASSPTGEAKISNDQVRTPYKRAKVEGMGVTANSKAKAAGYKKVLDGYAKASFEHPAPPEGTVESKGQLLDRLTKMVKAADTYAEGHTYAPREKPAQLQLINDARGVIRKPTPKNIKKFLQNEPLLRKGDKAAAKDVQQSKRIDADSHFRNAEANEIATENFVPPHDAPPRVEHEKLPAKDHGESPVHKMEHDTLVDTLNNLSDKSHAALMELHPDLEATVKGTSQPFKTMMSLLDDLSEWQKKNLPFAGFEAVPGENAPVTKRTKVKKADDIADTDGTVPPVEPVADRFAPTEAGAKASEGKSLKGSPEFEKLAAQYGGAAPKKADAVDGTGKTLLNNVRDFMSDESGSAATDRAARWLKEATTSIWGAKPDPEQMKYVEDIGFGKTVMGTRIVRANNEVLALMQTSESTHKLTPAQKQKIHHVVERMQEGTLRGEEKTYADDYVIPLLDKTGRTYDEVREIMTRNKFPGYELMPERDTPGQDHSGRRWFARRVLKPQVGEDGFEPITNRPAGLSGWTESVLERDWFSRYNHDTKEHTLYRVNKDGDIIFYRDRQAGRSHKPPFDPREIGKRWRENGTIMSVAHATTDQIMQHGRGEPGLPVKYSQNPLFVLSGAYIGLNTALERVRLLEKFLTDPRFQAMSATAKEADDKFGKGNHTTTKIPQFKGKHFPHNIAWALDDVIKTGFHLDEYAVYNWLSRVAQASMKPFYFLGPEVHVFNEFDKYLTGMGLHHANLPREAKAFVEATKSVMKQDALQAEIMEAGGNPMLLHSRTSRIMPQIAKIVGEEGARQKWRFDPIRQIFGVNFGEWGSHVYQKTNNFMWWQSDVLYTAAYLQFRDSATKEAVKSFRGGNNPHGINHQIPADAEFSSLPVAMRRDIAKAAIKETDKVVDSYIVPTTWGKSIGLEGTQLGRVIQKLQTDPTTGLFGRYHLGLFKHLANMVKNITGVNGMKKMPQGAAQAAILYAMYALAYPALSAGWAAVTGDPDSHFEPKGATGLVRPFLDPLHDKAQGKGIARSIFTPSTIMELGIQQFLTHKDFAGKDLDAQGWLDTEGVIPTGAIRNLSRRLERTAQTMVSPYGSFARSYEDPHATADTIMRKFFEDNFGLKTPTASQKKYIQNIPKRQRQDWKARQKKSGGFIEDLGNYLTGD